MYFNIETSIGEINKVTFDHVLYVPEQDSNLLSVQSCTNKSYAATFKDDICSVKKVISQLQMQMFMKIYIDS